MRVSAAHFYRLTLPFRRSYRSRQPDRRENETIVLELRSAAGNRGLGESIPRSYLTGEDAAGAEVALSGSLLEELVGQEFASWGQLRGLLSDHGDRAERDGRLAVFAAVEMALVDLWARSQSQPVAAILGGVKRWVFEYSGPVFTGRRWQIWQRALALRLSGFLQVKVKVGYSGDVDNLRLVRRLLGPRVDIRIDANGAWNREEALEKIRAMSASRISCAEQPIGASDFEGLAWLAERSPVPIVADESLTGLDSARRLAELGAPVIFNVRLAKCGGYLRSMAIVELARRRNLGWQLGCLTGETGILSMAGRHFAAAAPDYRHIEGSYGSYLLRRDVVRGRVGFGRGGRATLTAEPGLGLILRRGAIRRFCHQTSETEVRDADASGRRERP